MKFLLSLLLSFPVYAQMHQGPGLTNDTRESGPLSGHGRGPEDAALPETDKPKPLQRQQEDLSEQGPSGSEAKQAVKNNELDLSDKQIKKKQTGE